MEKKNRCFNKYMTSDYCTRRKRRKKEKKEGKKGRRTDGRSAGSPWGCAERVNKFCLNEETLCKDTTHEFKQE